MLSRVFLLFNVLLFTLPVRADGISVQAVVDRNQVGPGDVINLTVQVSSQDSVQIEEPRLPPLSGFELINTSSAVETRSSFINGKFLTTQSRNFVYMLAVQQKGNLTIPEIPITVAGQTFKTQPIQISATNARAGQQPRGRQQQQGNPFQQMDDMEELFNQMLQRRLAPNAQGGQRGMPNQMTQPGLNPDEAFFILAQTDKTKVFVGEQITVNFYLYTRGQIRDIDTLKYPDLHSFWKEEIEMATRLNFEQAVVNGLPYNRALLVSYALFPIKAGKATIDPYKAKCTVLTQNNFGFGQPYQFTKASRPIAIEVMEIPTGGRPTNYSGAVGHFRVNAHFEPPTGAVNQPVTLRVRFEGQGNAKLIELPKIELPPTFELYDQKNQAKYMKDGTSYKEFEVAIIPREGGVFKIPPVSTSVFDPKVQKFTEVSSQPLDLTVTGSATAPAPGMVNAAKTPDAAASNEPSLPSLSMEMDDGELVSKSSMAGATVAAYLAVFGLLGWRSFTSLRRKPKRVSLKLVLNRRLKSIRDLCAKGDWRRVGVELTNATYYVLGQISEQGGANQELSRMLDHTPPSLRNELAEPIQKLVAQCEALSFAPEKMIGGLNEKAKLEALIKEFETVMSRAIELAEI